MITREDIYARHPWQFKAGKAIDGCVPLEWLPAIAYLCDQVAAVIPHALRADFHWSDLKEKRGRLRAYYVGPAAVELDDLIDEAEEAVAAIETTHAAP